MKYIFLFLFLLSTVYANSTRYEIPKAFFLSKDQVNFEKLDIESTQLSYFCPYVDSNVTYKITLNTKRLKKIPYYLKSENAHTVTSASVPYTILDDNIIIKLDENTPEEILINMQSKGLESFLLFDMLNEFEYVHMFNMEKFFFGLVYGLMFYAFLNSQIFFIYNRQKAFLYYSLLQLSLIFFLLNFTYWARYYGFLIEYIDITLFTAGLSLIFSILFNMKFLNTKRIIPKFHTLLQVALGINIFELIFQVLFQKAFIFSVIPNYSLLILLIISAILVLIKGKKEAKYYLLGWSIVLTGVIAAATRLIDVNGVYLLHIIFPLEAIAFSFALAYQVTQVEKGKLEHERMLTQQSKLASMGEIVANIAHQWRQPLTNVSYAFMNLKAAYTHDKLTHELFEKKSKEINEQILFMSNTIEDFRNFFIMEKEKKEFNIKHVCEKSQGLLKPNFRKGTIEFELTCKEDVVITSYQNELSQVIFNLLTNAIQALQKADISDGKIYIEIIKDYKYAHVLISDNALGIDKKLLNKIFEPYFSTKDKGMGIGLYMAKIIIQEHMQGLLTVKNISNGAQFKISLPLK